jgi:hypothetical protein
MIEPISIPNSKTFTSSSLYLGIDYLIEGDIHFKLETIGFEIKLPEKSVSKLDYVVLNLPRT